MLLLMLQTAELACSRKCHSSCCKFLSRHQLNYVFVGTSLYIKYVFSFWVVYRCCSSLLVIRILFILNFIWVLIDNGRTFRQLM